EADLRPAAVALLREHPPALRLDQPLAHRQPDADALDRLCRARRSIKWCEDLLRLLGRDARPPVEHRYADLIAAAASADDDGFVVPAVLLRVAQEIVQHLLHVAGLGRDDRQVLLDVQFYLAVR